MALIDPKDAENTYNESGWAARRKEAREWRDALTAKEILPAGQHHLRMSHASAVTA